MLSLGKSKSSSSIVDSQLSLLASYITTTEFAKVVNVTRYTIINWVNKERIRSVKTAGGHRRIPLAELITFLESNACHVSAKEKNQEHCWQRALKQNKANKCSTCVLYGSASHYCSLLVTHLGKEKINCNGECRSCDYWAGSPEAVKSCVFNKTENDKMFKESAESCLLLKRNFISTLTFNIGNVLRRFYNGVSLRQHKSKDTVSK